MAEGEETPSGREGLLDPGLSTGSSLLNRGSTVGEDAFERGFRWVWKGRPSRDVGSDPFDVEMLRHLLLSRALRPLARGYKATTGLVGLPADPQAHEKLVQELRGLLADAKSKLPEGVAYRNDVEAMAKARLAVLEQEADPEEAEAKLGEVQLEELLEETVEERQLLAQMAEWKPWEVPEGHQVEIIEEGEWLRSQPKEEEHN